MRTVVFRQPRVTLFDFAALSALELLILVARAARQIWVRLG
jgi:hypothetical protein